VTVELGEIESCLSRHPEVREAAVVALPDEELGLLVRAHLGTENGKRLSVVQLKRFCSEQLPIYMVPDQFAFHASLPKTSTGKMDYRKLAGWERPPAS
jgi:acyl-CoA synthetase (AMP-forming)/AMP-acid ligase II